MGDYNLRALMQAVEQGEEVTRYAAALLFRQFNFLYRVIAYLIVLHVVSVLAILWRIG